MRDYFFPFFPLLLLPALPVAVTAAPSLTPRAGGLFQVPQVAAGPFAVPWRGAGTGSLSAPPAPSAGPVAKRQVFFTSHTHVY